MTEAIRRLYTKAGLSPPKGNKGVHTKRAHVGVIKYLKKGLSVSEAWKRIMGGMGRDLVVKKSHQKKVKAGTPSGYKAGLGGQKIRSKGQGQGKEIGKGLGPRGVPRNAK